MTNEFNIVRCRSHEEVMHRLDIAINGNGKDGLKSDVASIKTMQRVILLLCVTILGGMFGMLWHIMTTT